MGEAKRRAMRDETRQRIDAAYGPGAAGEMARAIMPQLCITLLKRLGGTVEMPVSELDDTAQDLMTVSMRDGVFTFKLEKKS
tara:strand:- start:39446 stop:39691 length:246 start_codon:yes stop_codon:yes gene_type:complete